MQDINVYSCESPTWLCEAMKCHISPQLYFRKCTFEIDNIKTILYNIYNIMDIKLSLHAITYR
jgi:hypothetical protein